MTKELACHLIDQELTNPLTQKTYKVESLLYEGSMAYIYLAKDKLLDTQVVIKALKYPLEEGANFHDKDRAAEFIKQRRADAHRELALLREVHDALSSAVPQPIDFILQNSLHPLILALDPTLHEGEPYLILEKISGWNLSQINLPLSPLQAMEIGHHLSLFLELLHNKGLVYQSLTPENVILGEDGKNVTILDFDSVQSIGEKPLDIKELPPKKQPFYPLDPIIEPRSDIYSLGALLYYLLTGKMPKEREKIFQSPAFLSLPMPIQRILKKSLSPMEERFSKASEMAQELEVQLGLEKTTPEITYEAPKIFPLSRGSRLKNGVYEILGGLSSGGQGRVYIARNRILDMKVLIKTPHYTGIDLNDLTPQEINLIIQETHDIFSLEKIMLAQFHSKTSMVPQILDFFFDKSFENHLELHAPHLAHRVPYLVIEYIQGVTLDCLGKVSARKALQIAYQLCHIIGIFHKAGYIYQDLKLSNVIIDERGKNIYLIDLGSLCPLDSNTGKPIEHMITFGTYTPGYRAPEWVEGAQACGKVSDVYSIGATIWALVSGSSPANYFHKWESILKSQWRKQAIGENTFDRCMFEAESPYLPLEDLELTPKENKAGVKELIEKALARDPLERYPSVNELQQAIQKVLQELS
ncbi:MAG: hypothetical protein D6785_14815 [Planctomycetota bacterium]|nr:MAG: hypothetical protein D6785_14815 [Planctomycetota bacterium]